ncbi:hypothetical protein [Bradyrhizobium sp. DASA03120]
MKIESYRKLDAFLDSCIIIRPWEARNLQGVNDAGHYRTLVLS